VRLYDRLFANPDPSDVPAGADYKANLNPDSLKVLTGCKVEPGLATTKPGDFCQFLRMGYFCTDPDTAGGKLVFNRTVGLRDTWAKIEKGAK
jgi:glutaminyl-tRNA synthetase